MAESKMSVEVSLRVGGKPLDLSNSPNLLELVTEHARLRAAIEASDGRLTSSSSAQLDADQDALEEVSNEILHQLGVREWATKVAREEIRLARVESRRGLLARILLRIGLTSVTHDGYLHFPLRVDPPRLWLYALRNRPWFGFFRNRDGVIKWLQGRWLPRRWGFWFLGLEVGDRGSSAWRQDSARRSLFVRK